MESIEDWSEQVLRLFDNFDAVKFPEENLILITRNGYLYYIYNPANEYWRKYHNAGNNRISISNYPDVSKEELIEAMGGTFPTKETDFMRLCTPWELSAWNLHALLEEDYPDYLSDRAIERVVHCFLWNSVILYKSYLKIRKLLDDAGSCRLEHEQVLTQIKELSIAVLGRNIFKKKIGIIDGHDCGSCFWIRPVRVIDYSSTDEKDNVAEMPGVEISIEEDDIYQYLIPFLYKHFDTELEANKQRFEDYGEYGILVHTGFEWHLTYNYFTYDSIRAILKDIRETAEALTTGRKNEYTEKILKSNMDASEVELIVDFYHRFIYRMEYMLKVAEEKGFDLISFMGP